MPSLRSLAQLRVLLPYAAKLLPVVTGVATAQSTPARLDFAPLNRHLGEMQNESRGLRSKVEEQGEQTERTLARFEERLNHMASGIERASRQQEELTATFRSLSGLLRGLFFAILFLLVAVTVMSGLVLFRLPHS